MTRYHISLLLSTTNCILCLATALIGLVWFSMHSEDQCTVKSLMPWLRATCLLNLFGATLYLPYVHGIIYDRPSFAFKFAIVHGIFCAYIGSMSIAGGIFVGQCVPNPSYSFKYPACSPQLHHISFALAIIYGIVTVVGTILTIINLTCPPGSKAQRQAASATAHSNAKQANRLTSNDKASYQEME